MKLFFRTPLSATLQKVKGGFNQKLFDYLTPPWAKVNVKRFDGCSKNDEIHLEIRHPGFKSHWVSLITEEFDSDQEWFFVDEGGVLPWPLSKWKHYHRVIKTSEEEVEIIDDIVFECRPKFFEPIIYPVLWATFAIRPKRYMEYFR